MPMTECMDDWMVASEWIQRHKWKWENQSDLIQNDLIQSWFVWVNEVMSSIQLNWHNIVLSSILKAINGIKKAGDQIGVSIVLIHINFTSQS